MSTYVSIGNWLTKTESVEATISVDRYGVASAMMSFTIDYDQAVNAMLAIDGHPDYSWLVRESGSVSREEANLGRVTLHFKGVPPSVTNEDNVVRTYSVQGSTSSEPIETHPNFESFAGTPDSPSSLNGATFETEGDSAGKFIGFTGGTQTVASRKKAGVTSFLAPGCVVTETIVRSRAQIIGYGGSNSMVGLGTIDAPPSGATPPVHGSRNWLLCGISVEDVGRGTKETRSWRLSGPRGWDPDIYASSAINQ